MKEKHEATKENQKQKGKETKKSLSFKQRWSFKGKLGHAKIILQTVLCLWM